MEEFMDDEMESEVLQMFACGYVDKIKVEPRFSNDQQDEEVQASSTKGNEGEIITAYTHSVSKELLQKYV
jgi:hypothetical protein